MLAQDTLSGIESESTLHLSEMAFQLNVKLLTAISMLFKTLIAKKKELIGDITAFLQTSRLRFPMFFIIQRNKFKTE